MIEQYYDSIRFPGMRFRKRTACDSIALDTPQVPVSEITTDPYAAEGKRLAIEDRSRRASATRSDEWSGYFDWRAEQGLEWWLEQERLYPTAANDNINARAVAA